MNQDINDVAQNIRKLKLGSSTKAWIEDVSLTITKNKLYDMVFNVTLNYEGKERNIPYANYNNNHFVNTVYENIRKIKEQCENELTIEPYNGVNSLIQQIPIRMAFSDVHLVEIFDDLLETIKTDIARDFVKTKSESFFEMPFEIQNKYLEQVAIKDAIDAINSSIYDFVEKYPKLIDSDAKEDELDRYIQSLNDKEVIIKIVDRKE